MSQNEVLSEDIFQPIKSVKTSRAVKPDSTVTIVTINAIFSD